MQNDQSADLEAADRSRNERQAGKHRPAVPLTYFSPSYRNDLERMVLLRKSFKRFYEGEGSHIIAVPKKDLSLFQEVLSEDGCVLITQESLVDKIYYPKAWYSLVSSLFPSQAWRFSRFGGKSGWVIQQIAKLMAPGLAPSGTAIVLDSDLFFLRPFSDATFLRSSGRMLVKNFPETESGKHRKHIANSRLLLGLPEGPTDHHYMSSPAILHAEWVAALFEYLESRYHAKWQEVLYHQNTLSEYSIYGTFVEEVLRPEDLIVYDHSFNHMLWDNTSFKEFFDSAEERIADNPEKICAVIQSAIGVTADEYRADLEYLLSLRRS